VLDTIEIMKRKRVTEIEISKSKRVKEIKMCRLNKVVRKGKGKIEMLKRIRILKGMRESRVEIPQGKIKIGIKEMIQ